MSLHLEASSAAPGPKSIWETELDWGSNPPESGGISLGQQASYLEQAFYELWRQGVGHVFWFLIRDFPYPYNAGGGVYSGNGTPKPAATAFLFPFVAIRDAKHRMVTIWGRSPKPGPVVVQVQTSGTWRPLLRLRTTGGGVFYSRRQLGHHLVLRAQIGLRQPELVDLMSLPDFGGRRVLVTGGSLGIGRAVCEALAEAGASVIVAARGLHAVRETARGLPGGPHHEVQLDVALDDSWHAALREIDAHGPLDGLVTSAGVLGPIGVGG